MNSLKPEISVIISTYDDRALIGKKLDEICSQTQFLRAEFIFVEGGSPGKERELLEPFCREHPNCRLITVQNRISLYAAWNRGWEAASSPIVCISNMDDCMHPKLMACVIDAMTVEDWDLGTVLIAKQPMNQTANDWTRSRLETLALSKRPGSFFFWRKELLDTLGGFDESLEIVGDKDFWARAHAGGFKIGLIPKLGYLSTYHPNQLSKSEAAAQKKVFEREKCLKKDYAHLWPDELISKIRRIRILRMLPFLGQRYHI